MDEQELDIIEDTPMNDSNIRNYFPDARILTYKELNDMDSIEDLLPAHKSYAILLVEQEPKKGHWVSLDRLNDTVNYFDSYGGAPDAATKYTPPENREMLGLEDKPLTKLLKDSGLLVKYNPHKYQEKDTDIKTCGRHVCNRIKQMQNGKSLQQYKDYMDNLKKSKELDYDEIVSYFFPN